MTPPPHARSPRSLLVLVLVVAGMCVGAGKTVQAQEFGRLQNMKERTNTAYFYFAEPGTATVQVQVWGTIPRPGIYEVSDSTSLNKLLSMAGGAPIQARTEDLDPPKITVRVYRPEESGRSLLFESRIEKILSGEKQFRSLRDDAIVVVETVNQRNFTWRDALSLSSTALSLTLLVLRILEFRN
ncbi:SLBB domain-containing protein [Salinibacter ruber]|uniref:SLBB domain-containing protein n=1 Tax=Salinibacter ruber TaxID=146919 RepID=UPI002169723D|nr:SLBB domain-containing protein [Salinibacter ruber]MCS4198071.1 hypothetical protein [Salinibacter ruber]